MKTKDEIRLSPKHGVNPSVVACPVCWRDTGVALLGRLPDDAEAPHRIYDPEGPCDECKKMLAAGFVLIEANPGPDGKPVRTGPIYCVEVEAVAKAFGIDPKGGVRAAYVTSEDARRVGLSDAEPRYQTVEQIPEGGAS